MAQSHRRERILILLRSRVITVSLIVIAGAICVALGREGARRVTVQRELDRLTRDIVAAEAKTQDLDRMLTILKSTTYEEGEARTSMNLQKPGEKVLVVPDVDTGSVSGDAAASDGTAEQPSERSKGSNTGKWWDFIFHPSSS